MTVEAINRLRGAILSGELHLGRRLSEQRLADVLGVSRSPVSQALTILATEGLVNIIPKRGSFVFLPDVRAVTELCEYRSILETAALDLASHRDPQALLQAMSTACLDMQNALNGGESDQYAAGDLAFHEGIVANCGNSHLKNDYRRTIGPIIAVRRHVFRAMDQKAGASMEEHRAILAACEASRFDQASAMLKTHISHLAEVFHAIQSAA